MSYDISRSKYELKYVVPDNRMNDLRDMIAPFVLCDHYMELRRMECGCGDKLGYSVRSLYFDTPYYTFYHEREDGLSIRKKVRIRGYNTLSDSSIVFLEIKHKREKRVFKDRCAIRYCDLDALLETGDAERYVLNLQKKKQPVEDCGKFLYYMRYLNLIPVVLVIYEREAYFGKFDTTFRITFDKNIRGVIQPTTADLYEEKHVRYTSPGTFVLEVKFYSVYPSWMGRIVSLLGLKQQSYSKYMNCIDANISVPSNRNHPCRAFLSNSKFDKNTFDREREL